jgi:hypothetical protein
LLRAIDSYEGSFITRCALRLAPLVFVRPGAASAPRSHEQRHPLEHQARHICNSHF